jgi:KipI family sensor histidine kinase inhibitor
MSVPETASSADERGRRPGRLNVGNRALLVELDDGEAVLAAYDGIRRAVESGRLPRPRDVVPAARTILVDGVDPDPWWATFATLAPTFESSIAHRPRSGAVVTIPIRYDGADLDEVADQWRCDRDEVVRRHQEAEFTVAFCGFAPGFAYCTSVPALPEVTRRRDPRTKVPAGAVGLAGGFCGIYPTAMPGGWQLIGTTSASLFDPDRDRPALLAPGDRVRFEVEDR